jgi:hypothetical protein
VYCCEIVRYYSTGLLLVGLSFVFQQDNTPPGYLTKKESDGVLHQMTWPPQSPNLNPIEMVWDESDRSEGKAANKCSSYVGTPSTLLERHSR